MSVLEDYAQIRGLMDSAIGKALGDEVASGLREKIQQKAHEKVYSYPATPSAMYKRRGGKRHIRGAGRGGVHFNIVVTSQTGPVAASILARSRSSSSICSSVL